MERLKKYLPLLLYSCKRVSEIISKNDEDLEVKEKLILLYHGTLCRTCQHYKTQSAILDNTIAESLKKSTDDRLSETKKIEIITVLKRVIS